MFWRQTEIIFFLKYIFLVKVHKELMLSLFSRGKMSSTENWDDFFSSFPCKQKFTFFSQNEDTKYHGKKCFNINAFSCLNTETFFLSFCFWRTSVTNSFASPKYSLLKSCFLCSSSGFGPPSSGHFLPRDVIHSVKKSHSYFPGSKKMREAEQKMRAEKWKIWKMRREREKEDEGAKKVMRQT